MKEIQETKIFAKGICFSKLFIIFIIGCVIGTYYEQIFTLIHYFIKDGSVVWQLRRGVIYWPLSPIYGAGLVLITYLLGRKKRPWYLTLLYAALIGGVFEYGISFLQDTFVGTRSWNYSNLPLNINGRTTVHFMLFWGICGYIYIDFIYPFISNLIEKIPYKIGRIVLIITVVLVGLDMLVSWSALIRQNLRRKGYEPITAVGKFYDDYYTDDYLKKHFPNMKKSK
ncbi:MAG: putative ABC transporter permease [Bacilli bacterium]